MNSFESDLANEFMSESVPIEESELISVNDYDDFITFTLVSQFQLLNVEKSFLDEFLLNKDYFNQNPETRISIIYQLTYDISFTDLNTEELYFEPIDTIKNVNCKIFNITSNDNSNEIMKLREYLFESKDFVDQLIDKTLSEELFIDRFRPFALEQYM